MACIPPLPLTQLWLAPLQMQAQFMQLWTSTATSMAQSLGTSQNPFLSGANRPDQQGFPAFDPFLPAFAFLTPWTKFWTAPYPSITAHDLSDKGTSASEPMENPHRRGGSQPHAHPHESTEPAHPSPLVEKLIASVVDTNDLKTD